MASCIGVVNLDSTYYFVLGFQYFYRYQNFVVIFENGNE